MTTPLSIDGSFGEGGGQILRAAASFSVITGRPVRVVNVRAGRSPAGLRPQHSATLKILGDICGGTLKGGEVGSTEVTFTPGHVADRSMSFDLGTAASVTLVLQAVVPAVALSGASLDLGLVGGTDVPWSPTSDYVTSVLVPALRLAGISLDLRIEKRGYYPKGGGMVRARIEPCPQVKPVDLSKKVERPPASIESRCGCLPKSVAERQVHSARVLLERSSVSVGDVEVSVEDSLSPGTSVTVAATGRGFYAGGDSIGARGKSAESVGSEAAESFLRVVESGACVDAHLADALAPLLCLACSESRLLASDATEHLKTGLHIAAQFTGAKYSLVPANGASLVSIRPERAK